MEEQARRIAVDAVVGNFRQALRSLVPHAERVRLPWREGAAYDDWDRIASALFEAFVAEVVRGSIADIGAQPIKMAPYDLLLSSYAGYGVLEVLHGTSSVPEISILHALSTQSAPFDTVLVRRLRPDGQPVGERLEAVPFAEVAFRLRLIRPGYEVSPVHDIVV